MKHVSAGEKSSTIKDNIMKTKLFSLLVALCAISNLFAYDFKYGDLYYNITSSSDKTVEVTYQERYGYGSGNYTGLTSATIPASVTYNGTTYSVTSIGKCAFEACKITSITIPNSVTSIGDWAFELCTGLTSITIPNSVTSIGGYAFYECMGLTSVTIGNGVASIGDWAFCKCSGLTSVTIGNNVTSIGEYAFLSCTGLTSITIPNSVTSIGGSAFSYCTGLTSITIPESVTSIGGNAFSQTPWYENKSDGMIYIGKVLYRYKGEMPNGTSINIMDGTICISGGAFSGCTGLISIILLSGKHSPKKKSLSPMPIKRHIDMYFCANEPPTQKVPVADCS